MYLFDFSHQTGWTSVVSRCFDKIAAAREQETDDSWTKNQQLQQNKCLAFQNYY
jgi:hypothetical protein